MSDFDSGSLVMISRQGWSGSIGLHKACPVHSYAFPNKLHIPRGYKEPFMVIDVSEFHYRILNIKTQELWWIDKVELVRYNETLE